MTQTINLGKEVMVSDPCYRIPTWCQKKLTGVLPGEYEVFCKRTDNTDGWGTRNSILTVVHKDYVDSELKWRRTRGVVGVDSGQAGVFSLESYRDDIISESIEVPTGDWIGLPNIGEENDGNKWYDKMCAITINNEEGWGSYSHGVVSRSGYGDGGYDLLVARVNRKIVGITIDFLVDDNKTYDINFYRKVMV